MATSPCKAAVSSPGRAPVGPAPENIERFAKKLSEGTSMDPIAVIPRGDGVWAVEGFDDERLQFRAIFTPGGTFIGAWDPHDHVPILRAVERELAEARRRRDEEEEG